MVDSLHPATVFASSVPTLELNNGKELIRFELTRDIHRLGRDSSWADLFVDGESWSVLSRRQAILKREGDRYHIFDGDGQTVSSNGIFVGQARINTTSGFLLADGAQMQIGLSLESRIELAYRSSSLTQRPKTTPSKRQISLRDLKDWPVELGRSPTPNRYAAMELDAPTVSRLHAKILRGAQGCYTLQDLSTNGTFVNSQRIERRHELKDGDLIRIGPFILSYRVDSLVLEDTGSQIRLDAHRLVRTVQDKQGNKKNILNDISLVIEPGQLVALVGGSGAGKSTLMKSLLSIAPITSGAVFLNGENLRDTWKIYRTQIGYVPQDDIVHLQLTVEEVLQFACKLRLPPDTDVQAVVEKTLSQIKLLHVRHTFVRNLSGGQRKRVSIGVELLADPKLFFLDEPTSGLDPGLDKEMMALLRELADQGRTVILVTHATANIEICDRITFLGRGGYLCYFGPPQGAPSFFEFLATSENDFADIYLKLDAGETDAENKANVDYWCNKYSKSAAYQAYIGSLLSAGEAQQSAKESGSGSGISPVKQLWLLSQRYFKLTLRDRLSQILTLISGPIAIALTGLALSEETPLKPIVEDSQAPLALRLVFIFGCIGIWIGLSSAVREIVKEAAIYQRERLVNLSLFAFLGSKVTVWIGIIALQSVLMTAAISLFFTVPESPLIPWPLGVWLTNFLTVLASVCLSLGVSASVKTENAANNLLPLIMIPQIIFSGVLFDLSGIAEKISWLTISRWSIGAYASLVDVNAMVPAPQRLPGDGPVLDQVFSVTSTYDATWENLMLNFGILVVHIAVYIAATMLLQKRKDIV
ncbi:MAG: ATP-binding cassette domain-containing protein [Cyanobacteria bacterium J06635_15]